MIDVYDVALAGLLHDIGKVMQRAEISIVREKYEMRCPRYSSNSYYTHLHVMWTEQFFYPKAEKDRHWQELANLASSHHNSSAYKNVKDPDYWLVQCLIKADQISAAWDRGPDDDDTDSPNKGKRYKIQALNSIFGDVSLGGKITEECTHRIGPKSPMQGDSFPVEANDALKVDQYKDVYERFRGEYEKLLMAFESEKIGKVNFIDAIDSLMETYFWSVPSNTSEKNPTNSLYYHSRITSGIASALYSYYHGEEDKSGLSRLIESDKSILMLIGGDLSGIQKYLFDLHPEHSKYAAKTLRARSFKIKTLCDMVLHRICRQLNLPRQCILMNAGGKFMMIAPNLPQVIEILNRIKTETEAEFFNHFAGAVSLNMMWDDRIKFPDLKRENFPDTLDAFIAGMERVKSRKFSTYLQSDGKWISTNFVITLCPQCGKRTVEKDEQGQFDICRHCSQEIKLGEILPKEEHFVIGKGQPSCEASVLLYDDWYMEPYRPGGVLTDDMYVFCIRENPTRDRDIHYPYKPVANTLPTRGDLTPDQIALINGMGIGEHDSDTLTFDELALLSLEQTEEGRYRGVPLNAVLKGDVDNLGNLFSLGLRYDEYGNRKTMGFSITQYATMSTAIDWFFSAYLPAFIESDPNLRNRVYTVYAGGDDFCLIGPWNTMIDLAILLNQRFRAYCGSHPDLHFSAAIELMHGRSPIKYSVQKAEEKLHQAKKYEDPAQSKRKKNCLNLFETTIPWEKVDRVMQWDTLFNQWLEESDTDKGFTTQFLYRLMHYSEMATQYHEKKQIKDLLYKSYLAYDLKRNFKENSQVTDKLQELAWQDELIRFLRAPLHKTLYKNRKFKLHKGDENE